MGVTLPGCHLSGAGENMKFVFEVDMSTDAVKQNPEAEIGRMLGYWAGNLKNYPMEQGAEEDIYDSEFKPAGSWCIIED